MQIGVPKETVENERRVALVPSVVPLLVRSGHNVLIESQAGLSSSYSDDAYEASGALISKSTTDVYASDTILKVQAPSVEEVNILREGTTLIGVLQPLTDHQLVKALAEKNITSFSMDSVPRIARAQSMDVLSSMASIAGYRSVLIAADALPKFFPMMMTAAGTIPPAKGLVLGAGVAGLQAIATARRLGAVVSAYDVRTAVKEQVESLGATFLQVELDEESEDSGGYARELSATSQDKARHTIHNAVKEADFVITTAAIPGRPAPVLIEADKIADMKSGSVIVDIAAEGGGNCELTRPGEIVVKDKISIHGPLNLPSSLPTHASQMYSRNMINFLNHLVTESSIVVDLNDDITSGCLITHNREIVHEATVLAMGDQNVR